jgi:lipopolysaccharide export LptBFGC system permease protein LptF
LITGLNIGEKGYLHPGIILSLPNAVAFLLGIWLWKKMLKK